MVKASFAVELGAVASRSRYSLVLDLDALGDAARSKGILESDDPWVARRARPDRAFPPMSTSERSIPAGRNRSTMQSVMYP